VLSIGLGLLVSLVCAAAVELGFGAAFVSNGVAWGTTCYATALTVSLIGRKDEPALWDRIWVRAPVGLASASLTLLLLRGPLQFDLPFTEFQTTGHSPFVVFPVATGLGLLVLVLLGRIRR
jgi:hypothetical protein